MGTVAVVVHRIGKEAGIPAEAGELVVRSHPGEAWSRKPHSFVPMKTIIKPSFHPRGSSGTHIPLAVCRYRNNTHPSPPHTLNPKPWLLNPQPHYSAVECLNVASHGCWCPKAEAPHREIAAKTRIPVQPQLLLGCGGCEGLWRY